MSVVLEKELPKGWILTNVGTVCLDPQYGWTTSASDNGDVKFLRTTDITSGEINWETVPFCKNKPDDLEKYLVKNGDVVISRAGSIGYSYLINSPPKAVFASYLIRFKPLINNKFFSYFLQSGDYWKAISEKKIGIAVQNVNATKLKQINFPLAPLNEQKRIVAKIEELFSLVDSVKENLEKTKILLKQYRQSILKHAFEGKLVPQDPNDEPASVLLEKIKKENPSQKTSNIVLEKELPKGWTNFRLDEIFEFNYGKSLSENKRDNGKFPVFGSSGIIGYHSVALTTEKCLIIGRKGSAGEVYRSLTPCWAIDTSYFLYVNKELDFDFFYYLFRYKKNQFTDNSTAVPSLVRDVAYKIFLTLPPLNEQKRIVAKIEESLSIIEKNEKLVDSLLLQYSQIKNSILKQAFKGKLVPQDPNDEPAQILLERIQQERKKNGK